MVSECARELDLHHDQLARIAVHLWGIMLLTFTKRSGKYDDLAIDGTDGPPQIIRCPKQGIIPHDMVHYAVESTLAHTGFLGLLADGRPATFATAGADAEESIERLVESLQAEMWGGRV